MAASRVLRTGGLLFGGIGDYVEVPDAPSLNPPAITILAWLYPTVAERRSYIVKNRLDINRGYILSMESDGRIWLWIAGGKDKRSVNAIPLYKWSHVAVAIERVHDTLSNYWFYINGAFDSRGVIYFGLTPSPEVLGIGDSWWGARKWKGLIDEVRIYNRILSADEISEIYNKGTFIKDGLVLCLPFHEGEGNIAHDVSGYGNHGTIYGYPMWVVKKALVR